jgi:hypothetical protein
VKRPIALIALCAAAAVSHGCGQNKPLSATIDDARDAGNEEKPPQTCHGGCSCATTAAACASSCYRSYTAEADGGLQFAACRYGPPTSAAVPHGVATCTYNDGGAPGEPNDFAAGCPASGCPAGTVCVIESGGVAGGGGEYCAALPAECDGIPTCACMGLCACRSGSGLRPEFCNDYGGRGVSCDNGIR